MKKWLGIVFLIIVLFISFAFCEHVNGYYKKNGTYVEGYNRSDRNHTVRDNYSYKGNVNPYTGEIGKNYYRTNPTSEYYEGVYTPHNVNSSIDNPIDERSDNLISSEESDDAASVEDSDESGSEE